MPFNFLLWECLIPGKTSISESGQSARIDPHGGECVLAFELDNQKFRDRFGVGRVCDALFFYRRDQERPVLLFVELKGTDIAKAAEQLGQSLRAVKDTLQRNAQYRAVVVSRGRAPARKDPLCRQFFQQHQVELKISRDGDLRRFL